MRFYLFLALSTLIHSMVLACVLVFFEEHTLFKKEPVVAPITLDIRTFTVVEPRHEEEPIPKVAQTVKVVPAPKVMKKQVIAQEPLKKQEVLKADEVIAPLLAASMDRVEPLHVSQNTNTQEYITNAIQQAILRYKQYPKRAQREGMQGNVIVGFSWSPLGLANLKILKPSRYALLNEYCLELIERASSAFPKVESNVDITIPIGFELL